MDNLKQDLEMEGKILKKMLNELNEEQKEFNKKVEKIALELAEKYFRDLDKEMVLPMAAAFKLVATRAVDMWLSDNPGVAKLKEIIKNI